MLTLEEMKERLQQEYDEITILEVLEISSEDLVEMFEDRIADRLDQLNKEIGNDGEEEV